VKVIGNDTYTSLQHCTIYNKLYSKDIRDIYYKAFY
jgi:hypothetical protein